MTTRNLIPAYALVGQEAEGTTAKEVLANAGLDFEVKMAPSGYLNDKENFVSHKGNSVTYRDDSGQALGNVGSTYRVFQNSETLAIADSLVKDGLIEWDRIGSIDNGRKMFASFRMPEGFSIAGWDDIDQYVYLINSHDGSSGIRIIPSNVRLSCTNQFAYLDSLMKSAGVSTNLLSIRHSSKMHERVGQLKEALGVVDHLNEVFANTAADLMEVELDIGTRTEYYIQALGLKTDEEILNKATNPFGLTTRGQNTLDRLVELEAAPTNTGNGMEGTAWGAFNVVTEYLDHAWVYDRKGEKVNQKRVESALLGTGMRAKDRAWKNAALLIP
jgi:phage/plasmid-like protein (TIGR03299 family)